MAVAQDYNALEHASAELRADGRFVLAAVASAGGLAMQHATQHIQADREMVLTAVAQDWRALKFASAELRVDWEVVLVAVAQDASALELVPEQLLVDRQFALAAVARNGHALRFVRQHFNRHSVDTPTQDLQHMDAPVRELLLAAVAQNGRALNHVSLLLERCKQKDAASVLALRYLSRLDVPLEAAQRRLRLAVCLLVCEQYQYDSASSGRRCARRICDFRNPTVCP